MVDIGKKASEYDFLFPLKMLKKDSKLISKILLGGAFIFPFLITLILCIIFAIAQNVGVAILFGFLTFVALLLYCLVVSGYYFNMAKSVIATDDYDNQNVFPEFNNIGDFIATGAKAFLTNILFSISTQLPLYIILMIISLIIVLPFTLLGQNNLFFAIIGQIIGLVVQSVYQIIAMVIGLLTPLVISLFIRYDFDITAAFKWVQGYRLLKHGIAEYLFLLLTNCIISFATCIISVLCIITVVGILALPFVWFAAGLIGTLAMSYYTKKTKGLEDIPIKPVNQ